MNITKVHAMENMDEILGIVAPIMVYWGYSGFYMVLGSHERFDKYRIHSRIDEDTKNLVSKKEVAMGVLLQQMLQAAVAFLSYMATKGGGSTTMNNESSLIVIAGQFFVAMVVTDTYMYFVHRYMHLNKFLYRHLHSYHHKIIVPYSFGSQYNHPVEGLIVDTLAGALGYLASGMSPRASIFFFSLCTMKTVDDHCGMRLPWNVFHLLFWNNTAYHDVHHQLYGNKFNFAQPFFVMWDKILGTHLPCRVEKREGGGFTARPAID